MLRIKGWESECFRMDSSVRQMCIMSPWLFNVESGDGEEGSEISRGGKRVEITWPHVCR